jgi:hypothetical protein
MFDYRATCLSYMIVHEGGCLLCVAALTGFKDGPMLPLGLGKVAQLDLDEIDVQIVLRTVS